MSKKSKTKKSVHSKAEPSDREFGLSRKAEETPLGQRVVLPRVRSIEGLKRKIRRQMKDKGEAESFIRSITEGAETIEGVKANIEDAFLDIRKALGEDVRWRIAKGIRNLACANECGFLGEGARCEFVELTLSSLSNLLNSRSWSLRAFVADVRRIEPLAEMEERYANAIRQLGIQALGKIAEGCKSMRLPYSCASDFDFDRVVEESGFADLRYKAPDWDENFARLRKEAYLHLLERNMEWFRNSAEGSPGRLFQGNLNPLFERDFFEDIDRLAQKVGKQGSVEIEGYKESIKADYAEPAYALYVSLIKKDLEKGYMSGAESWLVHAMGALAYLNGTKRERAQEELDGFVQEMAPQKMAAIEKGANTLIESGNVFELRQFIQKEQLWVSMNAGLESGLEEGLAKAKGIMEGLRAEYLESGEPSVLAKILEGLPQVVFEYVGDDPFIVSHAMRGCINCPKCGNPVNMGYFELYTADGKEKIELTYMDLHYMSEHSGGKRLAEKIKEAEGILSLQRSA